MFAGGFDREDYDNAKLARMHPEAYEAKMRALENYDPLGDFIAFLKRIFSRKKK